MVTDNNTWIYWCWTKEKPFPETLDTKVLVKFRDGGCSTHRDYTVEWWHSEEVEADCWYNSGDGSDIVAYSVVN